MKTGTYVDNRDTDEMHSYHEARIEVLKRRIVELETEVTQLRAFSVKAAVVKIPRRSPERNLVTRPRFILTKGAYEGKE